MRGARSEHGENWDGLVNGVNLLVCVSGQTFISMSVLLPPQVSPEIVNNLNALGPHVTDPWLDKEARSGESLGPWL